MEVPSDAEELAFTSHTLSSMARDRAYQLGESDAAAARRAYATIAGGDTHRTVRRLSDKVAPTGNKMFSASRRRRGSIM